MTPDAMVALVAVCFAVLACVIAVRAMIMAHEARRIARSSEELLANAEKALPVLYEAVSDLTAWRAAVDKAARAEYERRMAANGVAKPAAETSV